MKRYLLFFIIALALHALFVLPYVDWISERLAQIGGGSGASISVAIEALPVPRQDGVRAAPQQTPSKPSTGQDRQRGEAIGQGKGPAKGPTDGVGSSRRGDDEVLARIRSLIEAAKHYPLMARRRGLEGTCAVSFQIQEDGSIRELAIVSSSGTPILDDAALATIKKAAPFPPYPEPIQIGIRFALSETTAM